jgi:hypothetical protein
MLKVDKALQQVWDWKDAIYKDSKDKTVHGMAAAIRKEAAALRQSGRLHSRKTAVAH